MRLTIRRDGKRINLVDECARLRQENAWLVAKLRESEASAALARSSSNEWRDRYQSAKDPNAGRDMAYSGWGSSRALESDGTEAGEVNSRPLLHLT